MTVNRNDAVGGVVLIVLGAFFAAYAAMKLDIGSTFLMGPGYFPVMLGALLFVIGIAVALRSLGGETPKLAPVSWRAVALIAAAPVLFGVTARGLGLAPATVLAALTAAYSSTQMTLRRAIFVSLGLSIFCVLVFLYGVRLPLPLIGPWLGF